MILQLAGQNIKHFYRIWFEKGQFILSEVYYTRNYSHYWWNKRLGVIGCCQHSSQLQKVKAIVAKYGSIDVTNILCQTYCGDNVAVPVFTVKNRSICQFDMASTRKTKSVSETENCRKLFLPLFSHNTSLCCSTLAFILGNWPGWGSEENIFFCKSKWFTTWIVIMLELVAWLLPLEIRGCGGTWGEIFDPLVCLQCLVYFFCNSEQISPMYDIDLADICALWKQTERQRERKAVSR